ncbi:hypothetical protein QJQ45_026583 [Haematococcus lacustris]|nr:hypothetical protein QJQ45_026583 [Haematococcus lacustris]
MQSYGSVRGKALHSAESPSELHVQGLAGSLTEFGNPYVAGTADVPPLSARATQGDAHPQCCQLQLPSVITAPQPSYQPVPFCLFIPSCTQMANGETSSTDNPVFDAAAPPQEPAPTPVRSSRAAQHMAIVSMAVPELTGTSRLAFRAFSLKLRAYLGLNLHIPVNAFHHLLASSTMDGVFFQSIADAYEQLVDGWGDEADRAEALEALLDLVEEQLIDPPSHQAGLDPALVLGGKGCSSAKAFATAFESAVNEAIRRGTLTHFTAINHLFSHCLQVPTMRQEQRTKLRDEAVRLFHQAVPDAEDRQDQRAFRAALHAVSAAHENLLDSMRYVPATADRPPLRAEQDPVSEEVLLLRQQLAELQARALPQPPQRQRTRQPMPQPLLQPMPHHLQQPMQQMGYPMSHPAMQQPLPSVMPMSQAYAAPPMQLGYAAMPQPALRSAPMQHAPMQTQRSRPAKTCPLHPYAGHDLAECRQFQAMPPHEQQRVIGGSAPRAAHAVAAHPAGSVVSRAITDPRQRTPLLDRGYVPAAPAHAQHTCSYCHKRYHPPERCFKLYPHLQAVPPPSLSGPARAHTVSAEGPGLGAWDMSGHWVSQDARVQPLSYPEHGSFCIITANAARAVPFTPMSTAPPAAATHTLPKAAAPAPPAAPATTPTMGSVFPPLATQPGLQELAMQLQLLAQRVTRIEQHLSPNVTPVVDTAAHIAVEPPRAAAVRAACHTAVPNQHLTYFSNVTVQSGCAVADSEGQLHLLQGVMLDGGSDSCLISHECAAALNLPLTPCSRRLSTASGAEALATQVATLRVSLSYGTPHAMVHDLEAIVMPPGSPLAYDLLLGANFLSQTKGVCDVYDRQFSYCPRLHSHGDIRTSHSLPVTGPKGCLPLLYSAPMGSSQLLVACTAVSHSQVQPCATSGTASAMIHTPGVHLHVGTPPVAAGTTTPSAVSRGGDLAAVECALSRVATGDEPIPAGSGVKPVRSPAQPVTRRGGGAAVTSVPSSALDPAARRMSMPTSAPQPSASHLAVGTAAARRSAIPLTTAPPPQVPPMPPLRAFPPPTPQRSSREVAWGSLSPLRVVLSLLFLFWLPSMVSCLPPPVPGMCSPAITCSAITMVLPDGPAVNPSPQQYTQLPNGVLLAQHAALSQQQAHRMAALVAAHPGAFAHSLSDLTGYKGPRGAFRIELSTTDPIITKPRRYSDLELQVTDKKVQELEEAGIIQPVTGPCDYASAPTLPMKKDAQGQWTDTRFCIDFRRLNDATKSDRYGLPLPEEMFARVGSARWFSKLDMRSGFLQIPVHPDDQLKTAFWARNRLYCYTRMPFGLKNASAEYQRVMDAAITSASLSHCCMAFIDDVLVYSDSFEAHCEHVQALLQMLQTIGMFAHPEKTILAADRVEYLGHDVSVHGLTPTQAKCQALRDMPAPTDVSSLRTAMGVFNYYRCYIPDFSIIAAPITSLTRKGVAWCWGCEQQAAYSTLKDRICTPGLVLRRFDPERPLVLHTDWSREGCAGILGQVDTNGDEYMVACCSRSCNVHERNYASYTGEMLAVATCADSTGACLDPPPALASLMRGAATTSPPNLPTPTLSAALAAITSDDLLLGNQGRCGARGPHQWLVVAGWEYPHLPNPGSLAGLHGPVSSTFLSTMRLVGCLQQLQPLLRPGYVLVNTTRQHNSQTNRSQFAEVCTSIGTPLCLDAAQLGARTHHMRDWWTNICDPNHLSAVLQHAQPRSAHSLIDIISPVSAVPTAPFRGRGALLPAAGKPHEPTISPEERHAITERCMDAATAGSLYAISAALHRAHLLRDHAHNCLSLCTASHALAVAVGGGAQLMLSSHTSTNQTCSPLPAPYPVLPTPVAAQPAVIIAQLADVADTERDIHDDTATMQLLQHHTLPAGLPHAEQRRAQRRAQAYVWDSHKLLRRMADGSTRIVPAPAERPHLVSTMHNNTGHFGGRRTAALLQHTYWWRGLAADAQAVVARCTACDRVKAAFNAKSPELHSLPIRALFYRWGVDLCGPFIPSRSGHKYIMVCIEHLSKWVEIIPIPNKEAATTASAFAHHVLGRYGACAEVVTDGGTEFQGAFAELLQRALIDHRTTSANHPQSNGLSERCVQTVKACLRKHCTSNRVTDQWDDALPMIALGYRCSTQESTRMTPYELLFARKPVVPPAIAERVEQPINFDDPELAAELVMHRAAAVTDNMVIAMDNQAVAQHRDQLRYAMTRSGSYQPAARSFKPDAPPARFRWIQQLKQAERLLHVTCPSLGSRMGWVMVFSSKAQKRHLLKLPVMGAYLKL